MQAVATRRLGGGLNVGSDLGDCARHRAAVIGVPEADATIVAVVIAAAILNGAVGYGFAVVAVAGFAFVIDARTGIILLSVITPILTTLQLRRHWPARAVAGRIRPVWVIAVLGSFVGTQLLIILPAFVLAIALGVFALWYAISSLHRGPMRLAPDRERLVAPGVGLLAGVMNGAVGASGPVLGSYLLAIGLRGREWIFAISFVFWVMSIVRGLTLAVAGAYGPGLVPFGLGLAVVAAISQAGGFAIQRRFSPGTFQRIILVVLLLASANLLVRGIIEAIAAA